MPVEYAIIKPVVDAIKELLRSQSSTKLKRDADAKIRQAVRELLQANPNDAEVELALRMAKAADLLSPEVLLVEDMQRKVKSSRKKAPSVSRKKTPRKKPAKKAARRKAPKKKLSPKKPTKKKS